MAVSTPSLNKSVRIELGKRERQKFDSVMWYFWMQHILSQQIDQVLKATVSKRNTNLSFLKC